MINKYNNIVGNPFQDFVKKQLENRKKIQSIENKNNEILRYNNRNYFIRLSSSVDIDKTHQLYKKYNKSGSELAKEYILQGGLYDINKRTIRSGIGQDNSYGILFNNPRGLVPMPGITSVDVSSSGKLGTLQKVIIKIYCYDIEQLEIIESLYMKLGFTLLLEWGNDYYLTNDDNINFNSDIFPLDFFSYNTKEQIIEDIQKKKKLYNGNYDAILGTISNFSYKYNNGGFDCEITLVGAGEILESLKINQSSLNKIKKEEPTGNNRSTDKNLSILNSILNDIYKLTLREPYFKNKIRYLGVGNKRYRDLLNSYYNTSIYKSIYINDTLHLIEGDELAMRGNHHTIINGINKLKDIEPIKHNLLTSYSIPYRINSFNNEIEEDQVYITLGHLLLILNNTSNIFNTINKENGKPYLYIDYHDFSNFCSTYTGHCSLDPRVCIIPRNNKNILIPSGDLVFDTINSCPYPNLFEEDKNKAKMMYILVNINHIVNLLRSLREKDEKGNIFLYDFLDTLMKDISKSTLSFNQFRISPDDNTNSIKLIDDMRLLSTEEISTIGYTEIPVFGKNSIAYNFNFSSKIGPKMASMVTIAAQAKPESLGDDTFAISNLSRGLIDRINTERTPSNTTKNEKLNITEYEGYDELKEHMYKIYGDDSSWYNIKDWEINESNIESSINLYKNLLSDFRIKKDSTNKASTIIPLTYELEIDGISGILPNSAFIIPSIMLPSNYKTNQGLTKIAFIVHSITHSFDNIWKTKLTGQIINIRFDNNDINIFESTFTPKINLTNSNISSETCTRRAEIFFSKPTINIPINYLKKYSKKHGLISKEAIASLIAISAGESNLSPKDENHIYSKNRLNQIFPFLNENQQTRATKKNISKTEFFKIIYGEYNPKRVGNRNIIDGGKYFGRGYIQLTGHANYKRYSDLSGYDLINNPELVNNPDIGAEIAVLYFKDRVKNNDGTTANQFNPNYFQLALDAVGYNVGDIKAKKIEYYNCLLNKNGLLS